MGTTANRPTAPTSLLALGLASPTPFLLRKVLKVTGRDASLRDTSSYIFRALDRHKCHQLGTVFCSSPHGNVTPLHTKHPARFSLALGV